MSRIIVDTMSNIDVNELIRLGAFKRPTAFPFMGLRTSQYLIEYRGPNWPADRPPQQIRIQWTRCKYGGARPWFTCLCGRRVGKLYYGNGFLGCRPCGDTRYESQRKGHRGRLYLRATRMRARLGDEGCPGLDALPPRPRRMHRATYARRKMKIEKIEIQLVKGSIYRPRPRRDRCYYARKEYF